MDFIGGPDCCCDEEPTCPECCSLSSISFWMQYSQPGITEYDCGECPGTPFEVELTSADCGDMEDEAAVAAWFLFLNDVDLCGETQGIDEWDYIYPCSDGAPQSLACVTSCWSVSFTSPCTVCDCLFDGECEFEYLSAYSEYEIRAIQGAIDVGGGELRCYLAINILRRDYWAAENASNCDTVTLKGITLNQYIFDIDPDDVGCCTDIAWGDAIAETQCGIKCHTDPSPPPYVICAAAPAIATIPNPEYGLIAVC